MLFRSTQDRILGYTSRPCGTDFGKSSSHADSKSRRQHCAARLKPCPSYGILPSLRTWCLRPTLDTTALMRFPRSFHEQRK